MLHFLPFLITTSWITELHGLLVPIKPWILGMKCCLMNLWYLVATCLFDWLIGVWCQQLLLATCRNDIWLCLIARDRIKHKLMMELKQEENVRDVWTQENAAKLGVIGLIYDRLRSASRLKLASTPQIHWRHYLKSLSDLRVFLNRRPFQILGSMADFLVRVRVKAFVSSVIQRGFEKMRNSHIFENWTLIWEFEKGQIWELDSDMRIWNLRYRCL